jgi:hypothetical protein
LELQAMNFGEILGLGVTGVAGIWHRRVCTRKPRRLIVAGLLCFGPSLGATYYIAASGSDSNPGTVAQPFRTLQRGVNAASPGDTIIVREGTYGPPAGACSGGNGYAVNINKSGNSGAWITLKAERKWGATLDAQNTCHSYINLGSGAAYWVIENFRIINGYWGGVWSNAGADSIVVKGNEIAYVGRRYLSSSIGICGAYANSSSRDLVFDGNRFHHIGRTGGPQTFHDHGLYLHSQDSTIINNVFHHPITGWAIQTSSGFAGLIANNTFHGSHPTREGHIMLWNQNGEVTIRNNIFSQPRSRAITEYAFSPSRCVVEDNIVHGAGVALGAPASCSTGDNRVNTDPLLVDAINEPYDFHLQADSPAINAGASLPPVATDADGVSRPQGGSWDVGSFEAMAAGSPAPPVVTAVSASNITFDSATITWTTNKPADSQVQYGIGAITHNTPVEPNFTTSHSMTLTRLSPSTTYLYRVVSTSPNRWFTMSTVYLVTTVSKPEP